MQRLNADERGELLGEFTSEDRLLIIRQDGSIKTAIPELTMRFDDDMIMPPEKWNPKKPITAVYWEGEKELFYVKRFLIDNPDKVERIITDHPKSYLEIVFTDYRPIAEIVYAKKRGQERKPNSSIDLESFIAVKGITAMGNQLTKEKVLEINRLEPLPYEEPEAKKPEEIEVVDEVNVASDKATAEVSEPAPKDSEPEGGQGNLFE